ncbi:MAG TPA: methyl-accepting chemotaxis protein [Spirochaetota bacterium]|nr:methyl-accepting chemotaxis protein [Spirochaetota bacterium]
MNQLIKKKSMMLKTKISIAIFAFTSVIYFLISAYSYKVVKTELFGELKERLKNISYTGAFIINNKDLQSLVALLSPDLDFSKISVEGDFAIDEEKIAAIENSTEYLKICEDLNKIRDAQPDLILYAYILIPTAQRDTFIFIADADAPSLLEEAKQNNSSTEDITRFGKIYKTENYQTLSKAASEQINCVERDFVFDEESKHNIISGYAPLIEDGKFLGLLGLDISDKNAAAILEKTFKTYIAIYIFALISSILLSFSISRMLSRPLKKLMTSLKDMADGGGDLSRKLKVESRDELGQSALEFNRFVEKLKNVIRVILEIAKNLNSSTENIQGAISSLMHNLNKQTDLENEANLQSRKVNESVEMLGINADIQSKAFILLSNRLRELSQSISELTKESEHARELLNAVAGNISEGKNSLEAAKNIMENIGKSSEELTGIASLINDISDQINLLSLNASIESARAGDAGRGFAVVAEEISKLADKTALNVKDIDRIIKSNSLLINEGTQKVTFMVELFTKIIYDVDHISNMLDDFFTKMKEQSLQDRDVTDETESMKDIMKQIKDLMEEHKKSVEVIASSIQSINQISQDNSYSVESIQEAAEAISSQASILVKQIKYFKTEEL